VASGGSLWRQLSSSSARISGVRGSIGWQNIENNKAYSAKNIGA